MHCLFQHDLFSLSILAGLLIPSAKELLVEETSVVYLVSPSFLWGSTAWDARLQSDCVSLLLCEGYLTFFEL